MLATGGRRLAAAAPPRLRSAASGAAAVVREAAAWAAAAAAVLAWSRWAHGIDPMDARHREAFAVHWEQGYAIWTGTWFPGPDGPMHADLLWLAAMVLGPVLARLSIAAGARASGAAAAALARARSAARRRRRQAARHAADGTAHPAGPAGGPPAGEAAVAAAGGRGDPAARRRAGPSAAPARAAPRGGAAGAGAGAPQTRDPIADPLAAVAATGPAQSPDAQAPDAQAGRLRRALKSLPLEDEIAELEEAQRLLAERPPRTREAGPEETAEGEASVGARVLRVGRLETPQDAQEPDPQPPPAGPGATGSDASGDMPPPRSDARGPDSPDITTPPGDGTSPAEGDPLAALVRRTLSVLETAGRRPLAPTAAMREEAERAALRFALAAGERGWDAAIGILLGDPPGLELDAVLVSPDGGRVVPLLVLPGARWRVAVGGDDAVGDVAFFADARDGRVQFTAPGPSALTILIRWHLKRLTTQRVELMPRLLPAPGVEIPTPSMAACRSAGIPLTDHDGRELDALAGRSDPAAQERTMTIVRGRARGR